MRRRDLLPLLGAALAARPFAAGAQQSAPPVIGFLSTGTPEGTVAVLAALRKGLGEAGFVEDRDLAVEYRWAGASTAQLPALAAELVGLRVDVIVATSGVAAHAAKAATATIPIVFTGAVDPVGLGLAESIQRPGGNVTGIATSFDALEDKRLQILHELAPGAARVGYLINPINPNPALRQERLAAARQTLGVEIIVLTASRPEELEAAFTSGAQAGIGALYRSHNVVSAGSQENPVTDLMKPGWCRAAFQALQQASMRSSRVSMTVGRHGQPLAGMPAGAVEDQHGMRAGADAAADLDQMLVHRDGVDHRHDDRGAGVAHRTHRAKQVGVAEPQIARRGGALALGRPHARQGAFLADPHLVLEPQLYRLAGMLAGDVLDHLREFFLNSSWASASPLGWCGRGISQAQPIARNTRCMPPWL